MARRSAPGLFTAVFNWPMIDVGRLKNCFVRLDSIDSDRNNAIIDTSINYASVNY